MNELPSGWVKAKLTELADFNPKHDPSRLGETVSFVPMPAVSADFGTIEGAADRLLADVWKGFTHFAENDVIFAKITPCMENGKIAVAQGLSNGLGCGSTEFHVLRSNGSVLPEYLWRFLRQSSFRKDAEGAMTGAVGQRRVPTDYLKASELPVPPLAEQLRIVATLDALTARTARARADLNRIPALAARYKQSVLAELFSPSRLNARAVPFFDVLDIKGGSQPPKSTFISEAAPGYVRLLQIRDFGSDAKAVFIRDEARWPKCAADDIMVGRYGASVGKVLSGKAGAYNVALVKVIFDRDVVDRDFLFLWLQSATFQQALSAVSRSAQDGFNKGDLEAIKFPLLPLEQQRVEAQRAITARGEIDRLTAEATTARRLLDRLDQAVLAKAFRGELVPQDPADEPASVLLDRIRAERAAAPKEKRGRSAA